MTLAQKWQNAVCAAEPCRGCRLALVQPPATTEEKRRKLRRTGADGKTSRTGQARLRKRRAERRRPPLCCAELQMLCTQSIGYYPSCRQKEKKKKSKIKWMLFAYWATKYCMMATLRVGPQTLPYQHCQHPLERFSFPLGGQQCNLQ